MMYYGDLERILKERGYKITNQRRAILKAFQNVEKHLLTAAQVYEYVSIHQEKLNFSTVYRNLEILWELGIVKKLNLDNGINSYELNLHDDHHHHLICLDCGDAEIIDYCPLEDIQNNIKNFSKFTPVKHKLEIYGYCDKCKK